MSLVSHLRDTKSPVRQYLLNRYGPGLREVQREYITSSPRRLLVPPTQPQYAATVGTTTDWMMRFLMHPTPDLSLALRGAVAMESRHSSAGFLHHVGTGQRLVTYLTDQYSMTKLAVELGTTLHGDPDGVQLREGIAAYPLDRGVHTFASPIAGSSIDRDTLIRGCWVLALFTHVYRSGVVDPKLQMAQSQQRDLAELMAACPSPVIEQVNMLTTTVTDDLLARLDRPGEWVIGPTFAGSRLVGGADADLIASGLLLDLKTSQDASLSGKDLMQILGYALLDFDDRYRLDSVGIFNARYGSLVTWPLGSLLKWLSSTDGDVAVERAAFRDLLESLKAGTEVPVPSAAKPALKTDPVSVERRWKALYDRTEYVRRYVYRGAIDALTEAQLRELHAMVEQGRPQKDVVKRLAVFTAQNNNEK